MNKSIVFVLVFGLAAANPLAAQIQIARFVLGNGGAPAANSQFRILGTVGQPAIGVGSTQAIIHISGFWVGLDIVTSVEPIPNSLPTSFRLDQNYPNPFNPATTIQFAVPQTSQVSIKLYDLRGREVATLLDDRLAAGEYKLQLDAGALASGVYFYRMRSQGFVQTRKLTLLK